MSIQIHHHYGDSNRAWLIIDGQVGREIEAPPTVNGEWLTTQEYVDRVVKPAVESLGATWE